MSGSSDEQQIRDVISTWMAATRAGDTEKVLSLMSDDVLFLMPGRPVMNKADFAAAGRAQAANDAPKVDGTSEIQEITVLGDWAFMRTKLSVIMTPAAGGPSIKRAGHTPSILRKLNGRWMLVRDANMLAPVPG